MDGIALHRGGDCAKLRADGIDVLRLRSGEQPAHLVGLRIGGEIVVERGAAEQLVAHRAAHHIERLAGRAESLVQPPQCIIGQHR